MTTDKPTIDDATEQVVLSPDQGQALTVETPPTMPAAPSDAIPGVPVHLIEVFSRAASDPDTDMVKFEKIMEMMEKREDMAKMELFARSMAQSQAEMNPVVVDLHNSQTGSNYASYKAIDNAIRPAYTKHGFGVSFDTGDALELNLPENVVRVIATVSHIGGWHKDFHIDLPADGKGAKGGSVMTKTHAAGSAISYGRRYLISMIFNVSWGMQDADDDGNSAGADDVELINDDQQKTIISLMDENALPWEQLHRWIGKMRYAAVDGEVESFYARAYDDIIQTIKATIARHEKAKEAAKNATQA